MSKEHESHHHHHHHSHGRRNWVLPLLCVAMVVGGGYWMNVTSSDPGPQQQAGPAHAGPFGASHVDPAGSSAIQGEPAMENITPPPGQSAATGQPQRMGQAEPAVDTVSGLGGPGPAAPTQTTTR